MEKRWIMRVKGRREPIEISFVQAHSLKELMHKSHENPRGGSQIVEMADFSGPIDRIVSVEPMESKHASESEEDRAKDQKREDNVKMIGDLKSKYLLERSKLVSTPSSVRGMRIGLAKLVWWAYTGKQTVSPKVLKEIQERQTKFFDEHPERMLANPACWKDIAEAHTEKAKTDMEQHSRNAAMLLVEQAIRQDIASS